MEQYINTITSRLRGYSWEIYQVKTEFLKSSSNQLKIEQVIKSSESGFSITVKKNGRWGFGFASAVDRENIEKALEKALQMVEVSDEDQYITFQKPMPDNREKIELFDSYTSNKLEEKLKIHIPVEVEEKIRSLDDRIKTVRECSFSEKITTTFIINSEGLKVEEKTSLYTLTAGVVAEEKNDSQIFWNFHQSRFLSDLNIQRFAKETVSGAVSLLGATPRETTRIPVLFTPYAFSLMLEAFFPAFSGEFLINGKSFFEQKEGLSVASENVTILDNGRLPGGAGSRNFDDEGVPTGEKAVIEKGVFRGFLHNLYTANASGQTSTGNGFRNNFYTRPAVQPTNFYLVPSGNLQLPDRYFTVIEMLGLHTASPVTGDFSVGVSGFIKENGTSYPVSGMTLAGNFFQLLNDIKGIGNDLQFFGRFGSPSVLVSEMVLGGL
ncbi:TldD/PmbA family protein [Persephonella sp.]